MCQNCGITEKALHIHHKVPIGLNGEILNPDNCITLCRACHWKTHSGKGRRWGIEGLEDGSLIIREVRKQ
jgi:5-methylcytosine-specific restriction endonuclease McrA